MLLVGSQQPGPGQILFRNACASHARPFRSLPQRFFRSAPSPCCLPLRTLHPGGRRGIGEHRTSSMSIRVAPLEGGASDDASSEKSPTDLRLLLFVAAAAVFVASIRPLLTQLLSQPSALPGSLCMGAAGFLLPQPLNKTLGGQLAAFSRTRGEGFRESPARDSMIPPRHMYIFIARWPNACLVGLQRTQRQLLLRSQRPKSLMPMIRRQRKNRPMRSASPLWRKKNQRRPLLRQ